MTAHELADAVEGAGDNSFNDQASRMLRQQAEEIKVLHNLVKEQNMKIINLAFDLEYAKRTDEFVKRELSDEEIEKIWYEDIGKSETLIDFARAVLKKASEK
jgi:hypothetical protein